MLRFATVCFLVFLFAPAAGLAYIDFVGIDSTQLIEGDDLYVSVEGSMPSSCWEFLGSSTNAYSQMLVLYIDTINPTPEAGCLTVLVPWSADAVFPDLLEGVYTLRIYEHRPPMPDNIQDHEIVVTSPVSNDSRSWDALKALYR